METKETAIVVGQEAIKAQIVKAPEMKGIADIKETIVEKAMAFELNDDDKLARAAKTISWIAGARKSYELFRKKLVQPLNDHVKMINDLFKDEVAPLEAADSIMRSKMLDYQKEKERKVREEQERIRKEQELKAKAEAEARAKAEAEAKANNKPVLPPEPVKPPEPPKPIPQVERKVGNTSFKKRWTYEVLDVNKVPREYLVVDTVKVRKVVDAGVRNIEGIRIYEEDIIATR